jgi:Fe2+ or Zn2+ uptake regulation protein
MEFATLLRGVGLKVTSTRLALLRLLSDRERHMTADEITAEMHTRGVPVDRVTIYRNIEKMLVEGLLIATNLPGRALRVGLCTQPDSPHHHHIVCDKCGRVAESEGCLVAEHWGSIESQVMKSTGFKLTGHIMQYVGICAECLEKGAK